MSETGHRTLADVERALVAANPELAGEDGQASFALALARRVLACRQRNSWTQAQLAERAGMTQQQIADIERLAANPTLTTLDRLFTAMGLPKEFLEAS